MIQTSDNPCRNNNLFSNYYLEKYIPGSLEWKKNDHIAVFEQIKNIYTRDSVNKSKIKVGYNPKSPTNRKNLEAWHIDSRGKLKPLMAKIDATDALIDQIVYKLYGLTDEEIAIVEGKEK